MTLTSMFQAHFEFIKNLVMNYASSRTCAWNVHKREPKQLPYQTLQMVHISHTFSNSEVHLKGTLSQLMYLFSDSKVIYLK